MELHVVLDEWCESAEATGRYAWETLEGDRPAVTRRSWSNPFARAGFEPAPGSGAGGGDNTGPRFVERRQVEILVLLEGRAHWSKRWLAPQRRSAARRSLRNMMKLYCPEVLESFEAAVAGRSAWIREHRESLPLILSDPDTPTETVEELAIELEQTLDALRGARRQLRDLIRDAFPLGSLPERT
ncbi:hypothetical protein AB0I39_34145 [Kitasatospora purpeofusca]|uniref:hypothetical protein n=1 Tax=Kitasatospora purpeofusca TaxID=67352 RepID=UPI0033CC8B6D